MRSKIWNERIAKSTLLLICLTSCKDRTEEPPRARVHQREAAQKAVIIGDDINGPTYKVLQNAANWLSRRLKGVHVDVVAPAQSSPALQQQVFEAQPADIDIFFILSIDSISLRRSVAERVQAGAAVFLVGTDIPGSNRTAYIGPSDVDVGIMAARGAARLLEGGNSSVLLLHSGSERPAYGPRLAGFKQELTALPRLHLLREIDCHENWIEALRKVRQETRLYPRAGAWVFLGDWPLQSLRPDEPLFPGGGPAVVLCDAGPQYLEFLRHGQVQALVTFDYYKAIHEAMYSAIAWSDVQQRMPVTDKNIELRLVTTTDLDAWQELWRQWQNPGFDAGN